LEQSIELNIQKVLINIRTESPGASTSHQAGPEKWDERFLTFKAPCMQWRASRTAEMDARQDFLPKTRPDPVDECFEATPGPKKLLA